MFYLMYEFDDSNAFQTGSLVTSDGVMTYST